MNKTEFAYDKAAKNILRNRGLLTYLAQQLLPEFEGMDRKDIDDLIEGEINIEPNGQNDPVIVSDLIIRFRLPESSDRYIGVILDIEPQGTARLSYPLENRQWYYASRIFSRQNNDYSKLSKVYSIWINMECPRFLEDSITVDTITRSLLEGRSEQYRPISSPMQVININTGTRHDHQKEPSSLLELFYLLFRSTELSNANERLSIINRKYSIEYRKEEADDMLEFSKETSYLYHDGKEEGRAEGITEGKLEGKAETIISIIDSGMPIEEAFRITDASDEVRDLVLKKIGTAE